MTVSSFDLWNHLTVTKTERVILLKRRRYSCIWMVVSIWSKIVFAGFTLIVNSSNKVGWTLFVYCLAHKEIWPFCKYEIKLCTMHQFHFVIKLINKIQIELLNASTKCMQSVCFICWQPNRNIRSDISVITAAKP